MPKFKCTVEVEVEIADYYIQEGYNLGDMINNEISDALNGSGIELEDVTAITQHVEPTNG